MRFSPNLLEEILRRTDLVQLVGRRVKLGRKGRVMWGCCPFHKEKTPSFKVENERRLYKCFGCGAGGDAFKWLTETEGLTFPEAVEKLAAEASSKILFPTLLIMVAVLLMMMGPVIIKGVRGDLF